MSTMLLVCGRTKVGMFCARLMARSSDSCSDSEVLDLCALVGCTSNSRASNLHNSRVGSRQQR